MTKTTHLLSALALICASAYAQDNNDFTLIFESEPGFGLSVLLDAPTASFAERADFDDDGVADLTLLRRDEQGNPVAIMTLRVVPDDTTTLWQYPYQDIAAALGTTSFQFAGFFSFRADAPRHALFKAPDGGAIVKTDRPPAAGGPLVLPAERIAALDLTGDGIAELIVQNSQTGTVQVWAGSATNTATEEEIEAALLRLFQNYPNPFHDRTTIAYAVEQPGPVTVTVYDLLGRRVRTLVDERQPAGRYQITWDGRDVGGQPVASGTYFYRLRIGQTISSKQAIRIQ